mmetsp:Transcript_45899/g.97904  ORF Transcript_45899/g.97904 Transcript_45899/m.97904 type:complete len:280 (-) Transcript_45899:196-1035(-)
MVMERMGAAPARGLLITSQNRRMEILTAIAIGACKNHGCYCTWRLKVELYPFLPLHQGPLYGGRLSALNACLSTLNRRDSSTLTGLVRRRHRARTHRAIFHLARGRPNLTCQEHIGRQRLLVLGDKIRPSCVVAVRQGRLHGRARRVLLERVGLAGAEGGRALADDLERVQEADECEEEGRHVVEAPLGRAVRADEEDEQPDAPVKRALAALQGEELEVEVDPLEGRGKEGHLVSQLHGEHEEAEEYGVEGTDEVHELEEDDGREAHRARNQKKEARDD